MQWMSTYRNEERSVSKLRKEDQQESLKCRLNGDGYKD
jgi:hypothetical protein